MVHHDSQAKDVRSVVICLLLYHFWAEIKRGANLFRVEVRLLIDNCTLTEVSKLYLTIFGDQDVKGFDVSVDDVVRMAMEKRQAQLPSYLPYLLLREILSLALLLVDEGLHVSLLCKFHCDVHAGA